MQAFKADFIRATSDMVLPILLICESPHTTAADTSVPRGSPLLFCLSLLLLGLTFELPLMLTLAFDLGETAAFDL